MRDNDINANGTNANSSNGARKDSLESKIVVAPLELLEKYDRPGPRYTSYPTAPTWTDKYGPESYAKALEVASKKTQEPLSLYVHLPFCEKRCYFCGCNVFIPRRRQHVTDYIETLKLEITKTADALKGRNKVQQLHFGGGTPTHLSVPEFTEVMDAIQERFVFLDTAELSIEVDPRVTTKAHFEFLSKRGFNRISMGVQDFNDDVQKSIGRVQPYDRTKKCVDYARECGFKGVNLDLIYGLPKQTVETFTDTIVKTIGLRPDRVAVYSFAFLPTRIGNQKLIKENELPSLHEKYGLFNAALKLFTDSGYIQIGMDHFALPDDELTIAQGKGKLMRNFMGYTVNKATDLVGMGISSIGLVSGALAQNSSDMDTYLAKTNAGEFATVRGLSLSEDDVIREYVISSVMCNFILDRAEFKKRFSITYEEYFGSALDDLQTFFDDDMLIDDGQVLRVTMLGRTFVRNIAMVFDEYLKKQEAERPLTFSRTI
ncbi:oxygen-independent coproporphyrinogen III oxidase [bacterium AH-315-J21]|nr:oxygen-independent coproporphyrinogen III oxidase [bacterium AH-315-J21]